MHCRQGTAGPLTPNGVRALPGFPRALHRAPLTPQQDAGAPGPCKGMQQTQAGGAPRAGWAGNGGGDPFPCGDAAPRPARGCAWATWSAAATCTDRLPSAGRPGTGRSPNPARIRHSRRTCAALQTGPRTLHRAVSLFFYFLAVRWGWLASLGKCFVFEIIIKGSSGLRDDRADTAPKLRPCTQNRVPDPLARLHSFARGYRAFVFKSLASGGGSLWRL